MTKVYFFILLTLYRAMLIVRGSEQAPQKEVDRPKVCFGMLSYDAGRQKAGDLITHNFIFTNTGNQNLEIANVQPACGCTLVGSWDRTVAPGHAGSILISINTSNLAGNISKRIFVTSNDPSLPTAALDIRAYIWNPIEVVPANLVINIDPDTTLTNGTVQLLNHMGHPIYFHSAKSDKDAFQAILRTNSCGFDYTVSLTQLKQLGPGLTRGRITVRVSSLNQEEYAVPFWVNVTPLLSVTPGFVIVPQLPLKTEAKVKLKVYNNSRKPVHIIRSEMSCSGVALKVTEQDLGHSFAAELDFPIGWDACKNVASELRLYTDDPRLPELMVPVKSPSALLSEGSGHARAMPPVPPSFPKVQKGSNN